jgi:hypothetical protein
MLRFPGGVVAGVMSTAGRAGSARSLLCIRSTGVNLPVTHIGLLFLRVSIIISSSLVTYQKYLPEKLQKLWPIAHTSAMWRLRRSSELVAAHGCMDRRRRNVEFPRTVEEGPLLE